MAFFRSRTTAVSRPRVAARLALEPLEDRSLLSAGSLDPTFGTGGLVVTSLTNPGNDHANDLVIQPDGKLLAVGSNGNGDFALVRYNTNGSRDTSFGTNGVVTTDFGKGDDSANAVALLPDGKILVGGSSTIRKALLYDSRLALARYLPNGQLDKTFGNKGQVTTDLASSTSLKFSSSDRINALAVQADGKIVVVGKTNAFADGDDFMVARYTANGSLDSTFGNGGVVSTDFQAIPTADEARGVAIQGDGKLVVVGATTGDGTIQFAVARYNTNGTPDTSFGSGGSLTTAVGPWAEASDVKLLADGRIVVGGSDGDFTVVRYLPNGALDPTFGTGGVARALDVPEGYVWGTAMALQANGKVLVVGRMQTDSDWSFFALARFNEDGGLDTTFGVGGGVTTDFRPTVPLNFDGASAVAVQADGNIVVAGSTRAGTGSGLYDFALARYLGDPPLVAASAPLSATSSARLSEADLAPLLAEAARRWQVTGADTSALSNLSVRITDLGSAYLGMTDGRTIWIDDDAAGWGWFVDPTPWDDSEFLTPGDQGEQGKMDLLTVLVHEMGHILGLDHDDEGVMHEALEAGTRGVISEAPHAAVDRLFSRAAFDSVFWGEVVSLLARKKG